MAASPPDVPCTQPSGSVALVSCRDRVSGLCDSLLAMPRRYHALCRSFCGSPTAFLIFSPSVASFLSHDIQRHTSNHVLMVIIQPAAWSLYYDYNPSALDDDRHSHAQSRVTEAPWMYLKVSMQPEGVAVHGSRRATTPKF